MCSPTQPTQPTNTTQTTTTIPEYARPYVEKMLGQTEALSKTPYQTYGGERTAGFSPLQQQSFQNAQNMNPAQQLTQGSGLAYGAGLGGAGMALQANPQNFQQQVGGYMNPYLQMALNPQLAEANRNYDISAAQQQGNATKAGAFGGSREAIMAAENERNRNTALNSIIGQGYNTAFGNAQNQYNQSNNLALQGLGLANTAAGTLGQLGQNQYGQQMGINQLQNQYGAQQQTQNQNILNQQYQDFQNQVNYPYKQLGFMSDMLRGLPLSQGASTMYQAQPSLASQAVGLGLLGKGVGAFAEGGEIEEDHAGLPAGALKRVMGGMA